MIFIVKMWGVVVFFILVIVHSSVSVIYNLNESEYNRMPALFALDNYRRCLLDPGAVYCLVDVDLDTSSKAGLMRTIQGYSEYSMKHFNHTQIHRGVCVTSTCKDFIHNSINTSAARSATLEGCINNTLHNKYGFGGKVAKVDYCHKEGEIVALDNSDISVAVVLIVIITMNIIGSFYDIFCCKNDKSGNRFLVSFSMRRNWRRLVAPSGGGPEPRLERLKLFHGMRAMTMICVFFSHTTLIMSFSYVANPLYIEKSYEDPLKQILFNGSLVTHTFFVMSAFLLAYNLEMHAEKHPVTWLAWPKGVIFRWLRLTPTYALVLAVVSTLMRHAGSGPLWDAVVGSEAQACRQYWWAHIFYFNNYVYHDNLCAPQTWYLAADTQLFCVGLLVLVIWRTARARQIALAIMFLLSLVISAAHTYFQDLDAVVIQSPEAYRNLYAENDTFRLSYIRGHTNLSTYTLGLAGGLLTYRWQKEGKDFKKLKNYRILYWLLFPAGVGVILSGGLFYSDGDPPSTTFRIVYATFYKPVFQALVVFIIIGVIFKVECAYRGIIEWRGFTWMGRASYSAFFLHTMFQRGLIGSYLTPIYMSDYFVMTILSATIFMSYTTAAILFIMVEAPATALTKLITTPGSKNEEGKV